MKISKSLSIYTALLAIFLVWSSDLFSQNLDPISPKPLPKNLLSITYSINNHFDGNAVLERVSRYPILGLEYARKITLKWEIAFSSRVCLRDYDYNSPKTLGYSQVRYRAAIFSEIDFIRQVYAYRGFSVFGMAGINFRIGEEVFYLGGSYWREPSYETCFLRDFGVSAGIRLRQQLPYHFVLTGETYFTKYVWRYDREPSYPNDNVSTKNMLSMQVGLGYQF